MGGCNAELATRCHDGSAPILWIDIGYRLSKRPCVPPDVLGRVLPLAERVSGGRLQDLRAAILGPLEVAIDIRHTHHDGVACLASVRPTTVLGLLRVDLRPGGPCCHDDRPIPDGELRAVALDSQPLRESEGAAEPITGLGYVRVADHRNYR